MQTQPLGRAHLRGTYDTNLLQDRILSNDVSGGGRPCPTCGNDLVGTSPHQTCPRCGNFVHVDERPRYRKWQEAWGDAIVILAIAALVYALTMLAGKAVFGT